jgi:hypothetical protein
MLPVKLFLLLFQKVRNITILRSKFNLQLIDDLCTHAHNVRQYLLGMSRLLCIITDRVTSVYIYIYIYIYILRIYNRRNNIYIYIHIYTCI